ncbi:hypothetical protein BDA99DRAFT_544439 [Phascolomyces articulosus]|uniref:Uncharacterized protein n=1 Tax=Phascolomyces articulosus TaxID=60185 RepID=A0AAD5P8B2_9FUNG|nr:hypothetical protein BDA99DRAFT_544439 [Phascolomyces articulosus]
MSSQRTVVDPITSNNPPIQTASSTNHSKAIRHQNYALGVEDSKLDKDYKSPHNVGVRNNIASYIEGLQQYNISRDSLSQKIYSHYDYKRSQIRRPTKTRRLNAFNCHNAQLEFNYHGGEKLFEAAYMLDEMTDGEYTGVGKRVVVRKPKWGSGRANEFLYRLDELNKPRTDALRIVQVCGTDRDVTLTSTQREKLNDWTVNADE